MTDVDDVAREVEELREEVADLREDVESLRASASLGSAEPAHDPEVPYLRAEFDHLASVVYGLRRRVADLEEHAGLDD